MRTIHGLLVFACAATLAGTIGCSRPDTKSMQVFLDKISNSPDSDLPGLVFGYSKVSPGAQRVLIGLLRPLRAPSKEQHISIEAVRQSGRFTMIVARVPWPRGPQPAGLQPVLITGNPGQEQLVGFLLPFDDIMSLMDGPDMQSVGELSQWWIQEYVMRDNRGIPRVAE
jgi:hypothetical protein